MWIEGNNNRIISNVFSNSASDAIVIKGNGNILNNNIVDKDVIIDGIGNIVSNLIFTNPDAGVIVSANSKQTEFINVPEHRIEYR